MKTLLILCVLSVVGLSLAASPRYPRGCRYIDGICVSECEEGTHAYSTGCGYFKPEPTCTNRNPKIDKKRGMVCDFSACYCDPPTVRNEECGTCVPLEECPDPNDSDE